MTTIRLNDEIVSRSRNLRGLLDYARKHGIKRVQIALRAQGGGLLRVTFSDGATCLTEFASFTVLCQFVQERANSGTVRTYLWPAAELTSAHLLA